MSGINVAVVEGNTRARNLEMRRQGAQPYAAVYASVLKSLDPRIECTVLHPCEDDRSRRLSDADLSRLSGVVWTGSSLNVYRGGPPVTAQIKLFNRLYDFGLPIFGSCWGLQVAVTALGGRVRPNPNGREIGIGRGVELTDAGASHSMFNGKPRKFDVLATHIDAIEALPAGAVELAANANCIQAVALDELHRCFWGVQYHPEFSFTDIAQCVRRNAKDMLSEGFVGTAEELESFARSLLWMSEQSPERRPRRSIYGVDDLLISAKTRHLEIENWLRTKVLCRPAVRPSRRALSLGHM